MKQFLSCLGLYCLFFSVGFGQGLRVGDKVPDVPLGQVLNLDRSGAGGSGSVVMYQSPKHLVANFKGKLVLLDFWATWCAPCRAMMPRLDSLQQMFPDSLVVLPVAYEPTSAVAPLLTAMRREQHLSLPIIVSDTTLARLFPHRALPHEVWLLDGKVLAITEYNAVTPGNIRLALAGKLDRGLLREKTDLRVAYSNENPLLLNGNGGDGAALVYHSVLSGYIPGLAAGMEVTALDSLRGQRFTLRNAPFVWLARLAYADSGRWFPEARVRLLSRDSLKLNTRLAGLAYHDWLAAGNGWCYELLVPPRLAGLTGYGLLRQDIARLFPAYRVAVRRQAVRSLVLVRTSGVDRLRSRGGAYTVDIGPYAAHLRAAHLGELLMRLERQFMQNSPLPLAEDTGYTGLVDLDLDANLSDLTAVNKALKPYDLAFVEKVFPAELLTITDN